MNLPGGALPELESGSETEFEDLANNENKVCNKSNGLFYRIVLKILRPLDFALEIFFPSSCLICGRATPCARNSFFRRKLPLESLICSECRSLLVAPPNTFCKLCGRVKKGRKLHDEYCGRCREKDYQFNEVRPLQFYKGVNRAVVLRMKRDASCLLAQTIARLYYEERRLQLEQFCPDCVVAVPMNWRRKFLRGGINAPDVVAATLAKSLNVPCYSRFVKRVKSTPTQTSITWEGRFLNVFDAFQVCPTEIRLKLRLKKIIEKIFSSTWSVFPEYKKEFRPLEKAVKSWSKRNLANLSPMKPFKGMRVVVVDDAFTTGATTGEVARTLRRAGAEAVYVAAIARAGLGKHKKKK